LETNFIFEKEELVTEYIIDGIDVRTPPASSLSSRAYNKIDYNNKNNNDKYKYTAARNKSFTFSPKEKGFIDAPLTETRCDENSGIHGNSMMMMNDDDPRDPPPSVGSCESGRYNRPRSVEISYSTYPSTTSAASPSTPTLNDPQQTTMFQRHRQRVHFRNFNL
jgi:nucleoside-specific outer membrane channel protein Tsx